MPPPESQSRTQQFSVSIVLVCAVGLALNFWLFRDYEAWGVDFGQFYSASRLAGSGELYNWTELRRLERQHGKEERDTPTGRLPVVVYGIKVINWLPYNWAFALWTAASGVAFVVVVRVWPGLDRTLTAVALSWSMPTAFLLVLGQDTPFWLMWVALGLWLLVQGRSRTAGVVFALCICKFHLAICIPIFLAAQKRWSTLMAGGIASVVLLGACFAIEGPLWPIHYLEAMHRPDFSPAQGRMPNLWGISAWLQSYALAGEMAGALAVVTLIWLICRRNSDPGVAGAVAAAGGLLLARHAYLNDCALLVPLTVLTLQHPSSPKWLKMWAIVSITPIGGLLLISSKPYLGQTFVVGFAIVALFVGERSFLRASSPDCEAEPITTCQ